MTALISSCDAPTQKPVLLRSPAKVQIRHASATYVLFLPKFVPSSQRMTSNDVCAVLNLDLNDAKICN